MDRNGNMTILVGFPNSRGTAIQTNNTIMQTTHRLIRRDKIHELSDDEIRTIGVEVTNYVEKFGSKDMKSKLRRYDKN